MSKKHLYFYSSNVQYTEILRNSEDFEIVPDYDPFHDLPLTLQNEYGRFKLDNCHIHILVGSMPQEGCVWCGYPVEVVCIKKVSFERLADYSQYCAQCERCGSRGKILNINPRMEEDPEFKDYIKDFVLKSYKQRLPWDHYFVNPYEKDSD